MAAGACLSRCILIVPMCLLAATIGVRIMGQDVNILTQIGFVVLVGLAAKNAILIVEFARDIELEGRPRLEAVIEACRLRLRPILMTSFAFILGVLPLVVSTGSGSEMRQAVGVAVFFGMLGRDAVRPDLYADLLRHRPQPCGRQGQEAAGGRNAWRGLNRKFPNTFGVSEMDGQVRGY